MVGLLKGSQHGSALGIDIGSSFIKVVEISEQNNQPLLKSVGLIDLPSKVMENGYIVDEEVLTETLRHVLATSGVTAKDAVVTVDSRTVFVREVPFPAMNTEELREAVKWDMEKYIPYGSEEYYFDFAVTGSGKTEFEMRVLLVATPQSMINSLVKVCKSVGLKLLAIDIEPLALQRTLSGAENAIVIDIGGQFSQITLFQQGNLVVTRTINIGGQHFTDRIIQILELEPGEAETFKLRQQGILHKVDWTDEKSLVHQQLELLLNDLVKEVRRTAEYYQMQNKEAMFDKVFLAGGGSKLDNLVQHFAQRLDMPVALNDPLALLAINPSFDRDYIKKLSAQLSVALGLALYGSNR